MDISTNETLLPYEYLANAVILQAVNDYRKAKTSAERKEIEKFFRSEWFTYLTPLDGETLIRKLREELNDSKTNKRNTKSNSKYRKNRCYLLR